MKRILAVLIASILIITSSATCFANEFTVNHPFTDAVPEVFDSYENIYHWNAYNILLNYVFDEKIMVGTSAITFSPLDKVTRGMFITIMVRSFPSLLFENIDIECANGTSLKDVEESSYYCDSIIKAEKAGLIVGDEKGHFYPDEIVNYYWATAVFGRFLKRYHEISAFVINNHHIGMSYISAPDGYSYGWGGKDIQYAFMYLLQSYISDAEYHNKRSFVGDAFLEYPYKSLLNAGNRFFPYNSNDEMNRIDLANYIYFFREYVYKMFDSKK